MKDYSVGEVIDDKYKVIDKLGNGGFGCVLKVYNLEKERNEALKYCSEEDNEVVQYIKRFKREVRIMKSLNSPNVIEILDSNIEHIPPYFTMPIAKNSLKEEMPFYKEEDILNIFGEICKGVGDIHTAGCTHRDIKPDNILVFEDRVVVSDLGLAKYNERDSTPLTLNLMRMGTSEYMPPEQNLHSRDTTPTGDVFQLGKLFYKMLTNESPAIINTDKLPANYRYIIRKATMHNPIERFSSVEEFYGAIILAKSFPKKTENPEEELKRLIAEWNKYYTDVSFDRNKTEEILQFIESIEDEEEFIKLFNQLPEVLLELYCTNFQTDFLVILKRYRVLIKKYAGGYLFHFAETVSYSMKKIFFKTTSVELKVEAILATLTAAVDLNRFAAMDDFNVMIKAVKDNDIAFEIATPLNEHISYYKTIYANLRREELHPTFQMIWDKCDQ